MVPPEPDAENTTDLSDDTLEEEIALLGDLIVAASSEPAHLTDGQVDSALGIDPARHGREREAETR